MNAAAGGALGEGRTGHDAGAATPFPWPDVMHAGLCLLRLPSSQFWALTPVEFFAMAGGLRPRRAALGRVALDALMHAFPDRPT